MCGSVRMLRRLDAQAAAETRGLRPRAMKLKRMRLPARTENVERLVLMEMDYGHIYIYIYIYGRFCILFTKYARERAAMQDGGMFPPVLDAIVNTF